MAGTPAAIDDNIGRNDAADNKETDMSHTNCMIDSMINDSICEDRIIRASHTSLLAAELDDCCDGSVETGSEVQYWGGEAGSEWRIHLVCDSRRRGTW